MGMNLRPKSARHTLYLMLTRVVGIRDNSDLLMSY